MCWVSGCYAGGGCGRNEVGRNGSSGRLSRCALTACKDGAGREGMRDMGRVVLFWGTWFNNFNYKNV